MEEHRYRSTLTVTLGDGSYADVDCCFECGAIVLPGLHGTHDGWHARIENTTLAQSTAPIIQSTRRRRP